MSSYNLVNGVHTSSRYDLLTDVLRGEWGFKGLVMTDWDGDSDRVQDLYAGNDILMGGYMTDPLVAAIGEGKPSFNEDGTVVKKKIAMYGGAMSKMVDDYSCFLPDAKGTDTIEVITAKPNLEELKKLQEKSLVELVALEDGKTKVIYKGYDRSHALPLSSVQRNAIRVLELLAYQAPMILSKRG